MKDESIEITKIVIKMAGKPVELTIEQARDLKDALNELLGEQKTVYVSPTIIERWHEHPRPYWGITTTLNNTTSKTFYNSSRNGTVTYSLNS